MGLEMVLNVPAQPWHGTNLTCKHHPRLLFDQVLLAMCQSGRVGWYVRGDAKPWHGMRRKGILLKQVKQAHAARGGRGLLGSPDMLQPRSPTIFL